MIIRNNQTKDGLRRLGILVLVIFSIQALSFKSKNHFENDFPDIFQQGKASYYAGQFIGRKTANGEIFTSNEFTCAHRSLPFGTKLKVTNLDNNESIIVRVNDRGPYAKNRVLDLSLRGAKELGLLKSGIANVTIEIVNQQFSSLGNTQNMERIFVDKQFAYVKTNDNETYEKLYSYLSESDQLVTHMKKREPIIEEVKSTPEEKEADLAQQINKDSMGTSLDKQAFVIEE